jgi:hypothetical protein
VRLLLAAALLALAALAPDPLYADTLVDNVDGFTFTAESRIQRFTGLLIGNDGRVEQLFQRGDRRPLRADYRLDGKGRVLMPGLVDAHADMMALGLTLLGPASDKAKPRPEDRDDALTRAQQFLLERGVTTVTDMGTTIDAWQAYRRAGDMGRLTIRIVGYAASVDDMVLIGGPGPTPWLYDDRLRLGGLRIAFTAPPPPPAGRPTTPALAARARQPAIQLKNLLSRAAIDGFQPRLPRCSKPTSATDAGGSTCRWRPMRRTCRAFRSSASRSPCSHRRPARCRTFPRSPARVHLPSGTASARARREERWIRSARWPRRSRAKRR